MIITVNTDKLRGKMAEQHYTIKAMSEVLGIHEVSMSKKLKTGKFTVPEASEISRTLHLTREEIADIFFE